MATAITSATISSDLKAAPDQIWSGEHLVDTGTITSAEFKLGQTMGGVEVKVVAETGVTLTADLNINLQTATASGGSFATVLNETIAAATVVAAGDELARFILPREEFDKLYAKLTCVTTDDESAGAVDAYLVFVS